MDKRFEKIAENAFIDELQKLAQFPDDLVTTFEATGPEPTYEPQNYLVPGLLGATATSGLATGIGALSNIFSGINPGRNLFRNAAMGAIAGGIGTPLALLIKDAITAQRRPIETIEPTPIEEDFEDENEEEYD